MGSYFSSNAYMPEYVDASEPADERSETLQGNNVGDGSNKRRADECADPEDTLLHTPKKKKLKSTTDYIYQVLFVDGENSDVTITALGKEWKLHKLYLKQCGYFDSMFNGSWKEAGASVVTLDIPDDNIDAEALSVAFGCLYRDDLTIEPVQVVPVVAAACLLQLDGLMQQCAAIMKETISTKSVCEYYECSVLYGLVHVKSACFEWLENNIMCQQSKNLLKNINSKLMKDLVKSPNLFVMQVEMDVYNLLKRWSFLQLMPSWNGSYKSGITKQAESHFKDLIKREFGPGSQRSFLETAHGRKYRHVFASLRFQHIIIDLTSTNLLLKDRIIPKEWLMPYFKSQWMTMLTVEQGDDTGPKKDDVDSKVFLDTSLRCARVLNKDVEHQWRWIGFNYGVDLVVMYMDRTIIFKRNCGNQSRLLSNQSKRHVMLRVTVSCLNDLGQVTYSKTSGITSHELAKDGEILGLSIDRKATMPLRIALNILYYTPKPERFVSNLLRIALPHDECRSCKKRNTVAAITPSSAACAHSADDAGNDTENSPSNQGEVNPEVERPSPPSPASVGSSEELPAAVNVDEEDYAMMANVLA